jgi:hypothetical protein
MAEKNSRIAVPSFAQKRVIFRDDKSFQIQSYDLDNVYPQRVRNAINSSGTATACTNLFSKHLRGRGFKNNELEKLIVNEKNQSLADVHRLICNDRALYLGFAIHVSYNAMLEPIAIKHIPFEYIRLSIADDLGNVLTAKIHPDWARESGKPFDRTKIIEIDFYTEDESRIYEQIERAGGFDKWNGHLLYYSEKGNNVYPPAVCDPVFEDVLTDAGIKIWKYRGISTDFMANYFWIFPGEFADDRERENYISSVNSFQGADNSHKIAVVECPVPDSKPELIKIDKQDNDKVYELTEVTVRENIIRAYGQPLALHAIHLSGSLGLSREWEEAKSNYDERTADDREKISFSFKPILSRWSFGNPAPDGDYSVVPLTGLADEKQTKPISETLEVGKLVSLQTVITDTSMTSEQKINFLVAVYGIDFETSVSIVNGTPLPIEKKI